MSNTRESAGISGLDNGLVVEVGAMPDVQGTSDGRGITIDKVGVKDVRYPLLLKTRDGGDQTTVATIDMYVSLCKTRKGTHMSRFLEVLNEHPGPITPTEIPHIARKIRQRLDAADAHFRADFTYFIRKHAPVTNIPGVMDYQVTFECTSNDQDGEDFILGVTAPATSLCPCSKEISVYGAHNQRCDIEAKIRFRGMVWIEDLAEVIEKSASTQVYSVLKRPDEKFVTEEAYEHPKFVEDIVRDLALELNQRDRVLWYSINSTNFESIHNHNAYAQLTFDKRSP